MDPLVSSGYEGRVMERAVGATALSFLASPCRQRLGDRPMGVAAVFIDGGYLDKVLAYDHKKPRINYEELAAEMATPDSLLRAYYYHCLPYQSSSPTEDERKRYASMHRFITALRFIPRFEVRLGKLAYRGRDLATGAPIFVQKRVDNMVGVDMAILAGKGKITNVSILTGDSDFIPSIEAVKREGVLVTLWHGSLTGTNTAPSRELYEICDERRELAKAIVAKLKR